MEKSFLWKANQCVLIHIFHLRSVLEFIMLYEVIKYRDDVFRLPVPILINHFGGLFLVAFYLTPYWTYRKTLQFFNPVDFSIKSNVEEKTE
jgi:ceroid-lipofuscinosis protein 8